MCADSETTKTAGQQESSAVEASSPGLVHADTGKINKIYYFTGTGNTLACAKKIADILGNTELISIASLQRGEEVDFGDAETVGIFHPVYCFGVPSIVMNFIERIKKTEKKIYVYSLCTSGGMKGSAHLIMEQALAKQDIKLNAYFHVKMPSNYIPLSKKPSPQQLVKIFDAADKKIVKIGDFIQKRESHTPLHVFPFDMIGEMVGKRSVSYIGDYDKYFWLTENCDGCEICEHICPASNIIVMNGMPTWRGHCEQCMACLQWCPKQAIQFRQVTLKRERYHHPDIQISELFRKN